MQDSVAVADGGAGDQLCGVGNAVAVEVWGDLHVVGADVEIGDRVMPGIVLGEHIDVRPGRGAIHIVVARIVVEGLRPRGVVRRE